MLGHQEERLEDRRHAHLRAGPGGGRAQRPARELQGGPAPEGRPRGAAGGPRHRVVRPERGLLRDHGLRVPLARLLPGAGLQRLRLQLQWFRPVAGAPHALGPRRRRQRRDRVPAKARLHAGGRPRPLHRWHCRVQLGTEQPRYREDARRGPHVLDAREGREVHVRGLGREGPRPGHDVGRQLLELLPVPVLQGDALRPKGRDDTRRRGLALRRRGSGRRADPAERAPHRGRRQGQPPLRRLGLL
mmetsp:Transcript_101256/g.287113  ORF Transcript_101256/g.287113 Transcript_101256/m.287113 type:complete len:245 (+) Transcript_101256:932-1666(+)